MEAYLGTYFERNECFNLLSVNGTRLVVDAHHRVQTLFAGDYRLPNRHIIQFLSVYHNARNKLAKSGVLTEWFSL
jgi:hypothetical protein